MKEVMVTVDAQSSCQQRIEIAASYASKAGAHLTGLFITPEIHFPRYVSEGVVADARQQHYKEFERRVESARGVFQEVAKNVGVSAELLALQGDFNEVVIGYSRCADLLVMGQAMKDQGEIAYQESPDKVILRSGRPVVVVPYVRCAARDPKRVVVAWDGSREASRALHDAIPLLKLADIVDVVTVAEPKGTAAKYASIDLLVAQLARHGINAKGSQLGNSNISIGDRLLNHVVDNAADLLVAGAYGHTRLRELVMGGVTQDLLEHCSIPVLMSR